MLTMKTVRVADYERAFLFRDRNFKGILGPGKHRLWALRNEIEVQVLNLQNPRIAHGKLDVIVASGALDGEAKIVDLKEHEKALLWIDGRLDDVLSPGLYAFWTVLHEVKVEVFDIRKLRFEHEQFDLIVNRTGTRNFVDVYEIASTQVGMLYVDGVFVETLAPGVHAFWRGVRKVRVMVSEQREQSLDLAGQEILTADRVSVRVNATLSYREVDPIRAMTESADAKQALYREAQLALRAVIGSRELEAFLADKDTPAREMAALVKQRAEELGLRVTSFGIRDLILPGEIRDLMNKVTEARQAAEAAAITRREETASMRSQANTAKVIEGNPVLMRLRELETLEKIAEKTNITVMLGDKGLAEHVTKLI